MEKILVTQIKVVHKEIIIIQLQISLIAKPLIIKKEVLKKIISMKIMISPVEVQIKAIEVAIQEDLAFLICLC